MENSLDFSVEGIIADPYQQRMYEGIIKVKNGIIVDILSTPVKSKSIITAVLVDAHMHPESTLNIPPEAARLLVRRGVVAVLSDPHEIANVLGIDGVNFMIEAGKKVPFYFFWGAPSCVPATNFETAGASLLAEEVCSLLDRREVTHLAEVMNFPGVIADNPSLMKMVSYARSIGKEVDAHAPGLVGEQMQKYFQRLGSAADHECFTLEEALAKLQVGAKIAIGEGSAAKNFNALWPLLNTHPDDVMFCSDDAHPDYIRNGWESSDINYGHIDMMLKRAIANGISPLVALKAAASNAVIHYDLPVGRLRIGDPADFIIMESFDTCKVLETYYQGRLISLNGQSLIPQVTFPSINNFNCNFISKSEIKVVNDNARYLKVIKVQPGQLVTQEILVKPKILNNEIVSDPTNDLVKLVVVNRYQNAPPAVAFASGLGIKVGAIASSVAHDSHNIIAAGANDEDLIAAINLIIENKGGLALCHSDIQKILPLPYAGLMSNLGAFKVAQLYEELDRLSKEELGSYLPAPFMTLSFLALLVIPALKLSDKGLFDGDKFEFTNLLVR